MPGFISKDGKVFVKTRTGELYQAPSEAAAQDYVDSGDYLPAEAADIAKRNAEKRSGGMVATFGAGINAANAAAFDAATAIPRVATALGSAALGVEDPLKDVSGRNYQEGLVALGAEALSRAGLTERGAEAAGAQYGQAVREQAEAHPVASALGYAGGSIAGGMGLARAASALGGRVATATGSRALGFGAAGLTEGAALGATQAGEDAYLEDTELSAEQSMAGMGLGSIIGGGVGLAAGGLARVFGRRGTRGATPVDSPHLGSARSDEALEATATRVLGTRPAPGFGSKLREALEDAQAAVAGVDRRSLAEVGATRTGDAAKKKRSLWWNREQVWEGNTNKLTAELEKLADDADDVLDEVVDSGLKKTHVSTKLTGDADAMVSTAQAEFRRLREELVDVTLRGDEFGNAALAQKQLKLLDAYEPNFVAARSAGAASKDMAADAFIALDKTKRALQKHTKALRRSAMGDDAYKQMQNRALADHLDGIQERTRKLLESQEVWGEAGMAQSSVNAKWQEYLRTSETFRNSFLRRVEGTDYSTGRAVWRVDPDKVASYVRKTGRSEGQLVDEYFRRHVRARKELAEAIGGAYDLGAKSSKVKDIGAATQSVQKTLGELDETAKAVNQIEAIMEAERTSGVGILGGLGVGSLAGGPMGALAGAAFGAVSRPGQMIRQMAAIEQLARNVDSKVARGLKGFLTRATEPRLPKGAAKSKALPNARPALIPSSLAAFRGNEASNQLAYEKRVKELHAVSADYGRGVRNSTRTALGDDFIERAPRLAGAITVKATNGIEFLKSKLPASTFAPTMLNPSRSNAVSDLEIAKFARYWSAVSNPLGVLDELQNGTLTHEHVEALKAVYPRFYDGLRQQALSQIRELDSVGRKVSYQARLQLDLLLDLGGAGEPTLEPGFMSRFAQLSAEQAQQQAQPKPSARPMQVASSRRSATEMITLGAEEARGR